MALLQQANRVNQPLNQVLQDFSTQTPPRTEDSALALVIQDTQRAEKFIMARLWVSEWRVAKAIYEAPVKQEFWRDTLVPRASNSYPLVAQHVRAILNQVMPALFPDNPPFAMEPNEGTPRQVSRGWESILGHQLRAAGFKQEVRLIAKDAEIFGTGIGKWGWESFTRRRTVYSRAVTPKKVTGIGGKAIYHHTVETDALNAQDIDEVIDRPFFKRCEVNHVLVAPGLRVPDIRQAAYVIYRDYLTIRDLNRLRDFEGYVIPSEDELKLLAAPPAEKADSSAVEAEATTYPAQGHRPLPRYLDESEDPLEHKLEVLERWTNDHVIVVLQRKKVIRKELNPLGIIPFVSCFWDDVPGSFYAFGIPRRIGSIQTHIQGLRNLRLDDVNLNLQNVWLEQRGTNIAAQPQRMYPGARWKVDNIKGLIPLIKQPVLREAYQEEQVLVSDAEKTTGANEMLVQGALPQQGRTSMGRTAGGANLLGGASSAQVQGFVDIIVEQVFIPTLNAFLHMDREMLDPSQMRKIIGKTLWQAMEDAHEGNDLTLDMCNNADISFKMLAGTNIASRRAMISALPLQSQMFEAPAVQQGLQQAGYKVNWVELARRTEQASGWKSEEDIIIPMTPEEIQQAQQSNPELIKGQMTLQRIAQLHKQNMELSGQEHEQRLAEIDAKGMAGAGEQILTRELERKAEQEEAPMISGGLEG